MVTITSHIFINLPNSTFFIRVQVMRKIWSFFWYQNLWKFEENLKQSDQAPLIHQYLPTQAQNKYFLADLFLYLRWWQLVKYVYKLRDIRGFISQYSLVWNCHLHVIYPQFSKISKACCKNQSIINQSINQSIQIKCWPIRTNPYTALILHIHVALLPEFAQSST